MKKLRELVEYIREELHDAKKYAKKAICYKEKDRELADMYISLSKQELEHADVETRSAQNVLSAAKKIGDEAYESMEQFWDW